MKVPSWVPAKRTFVKYVSSGELVPAWYGVAKIDILRAQAMCLPLGLNILYGIAYQIRIALKHGWRPTPYDSHEAFAQGFEAGMKAEQAKWEDLT